MMINSHAQYFYDLLDTICLSNGCVVMLRAYFDASERRDGTFCVSGYAIQKSRIKKFDREWQSIFNNYGGCHMKELVHRRGRFKGIDVAEKDRLIKEAVKLINRRIAHGVAISCNLSEINKLLPKWKRGFEGAYPVCCHMAMFSLGEKVIDSGFERIAYIFENGDRYSGCANEFMHRAVSNPELKFAYQYYSHTFIDKSDAYGLQAADFFAWEWAKYLDETVGKRKRDMRMSLVNMLKSDSSPSDIDKRYKFHHMSGEPLREFCNRVASFGLADATKNPNLNDDLLCG